MFSGSMKARGGLLLLLAFSVGVCDLHRAAAEEDVKQITLEAETEASGDLPSVPLEPAYDASVSTEAPGSEECLVGDDGSTADSGSYTACACDVDEHALKSDEDDTPDFDNESCPCACSNQAESVCSNNCSQEDEVVTKAVEVETAAGAVTAGRRLLSIEGDEVKPALSESERLYAATVRKLMSTLDTQHDTLTTDMHLGYVDITKSTAESAVSAPEGAASRRLLAPSYLPAAATCFGDRSAGCCGSQRCEEVAPGSGSGFEVNVKKTETELSGETHTTFDWTVASASASLQLRQFAALLTVNAMAELSLSHHSTEALHQTTHIGCSPFDGFVAWRQVCREESTIQDTFSFTVKGSKCLKDICRPIAVPDGDTGNMKVLQPVSSNPEDSCCVWTIQGQDMDEQGQEKCYLGRVCESEGPVIEEPEPEAPPSCPTWKLKAYPVRTEDLASFEPFVPVIAGTNERAVEAELMSMTKYLEAGALRLGPNEGALPVFANWETEIHGLMGQPGLEKYTDTDWNLAIDATAQLCPPANMVGVPVKFIVQASGAVRIQLGTENLGVAHQDCSSSGCARPTPSIMPDTSLQLAAGCQPITISFADSGAKHKWLHISLRRWDGDCLSDDAEYPACTKVVDDSASRRRQLLDNKLQHLDSRSHSLLDHGQPRDVALSGAAGWGRSLLSATDTESDPEQEEVNASLDVDKPVDEACEVLRKAIFQNLDECPRPSAPPDCKACQHAWLAEVFQKLDPTDNSTFATMPTIPADLVASGIPVYAENVAQIWSPASTSAFISSYTADYAVRYTSHICFARPTQLKFRVCTDNTAAVMVNHVEVFRKEGPRSKRCYRNKNFTPVAAGCHHLQVLYAQYPGEKKQGITFKIRQRHTWKCPSYSEQCPVARLLLHPNGCLNCLALPTVKPVTPIPKPPVPPYVPPAPSCPPAGLVFKGWEVCAWHNPKTVSVSSSAKDLEGISGLDWSQRDAAWSTANCRMMDHIAFHTRCGRYPYSSRYGLKDFKDKFSFRMRTQYRPARDTTGRFKVFANDGFMLEACEMHVVEGQLVVKSCFHKFGRPQPQWGCRSKSSPSDATFQGGKIYRIDVKYYQNDSSKCIKILWKKKNNCRWDTLKGGYHPAWQPSCSASEATPPAVVLPPVIEPPPVPVPTSTCPRFRLKFWHAKQLNTCGQWSSYRRIAKGAPDFEVPANRIQWSRQNDGSAISSAPGYRQLTGKYFLKAEGRVCVPDTRYNMLKFKVWFSGRTILNINNKEYLSQDSSRNDKDIKESAAGYQSKVYVIRGDEDRCFDLQLLYKHVHKSHGIDVKIQMGAWVKRYYGYRYAWSSKVETLQDGGNYGIKVRHPDATVTCADSPAVCQGPCCGTCNPDEVDLNDAGVRLEKTRFWAVGNKVKLQLKLEKVGCRSDLPAKWRSWRHVQVLLNDDTLEEYGSSSGRRKGSYSSPAPITGDEIDNFCHASTGQKGPVWDVKQVQYKRSHMITLSRGIQKGSTAQFGADYLCNQEAHPRQAEIKQKDPRVLSSCVVMFTFKDNSCAYGLLVFRQRVRQVVPVHVPVPQTCSCGAGGCPGSKVCLMSQTPVRVSRAVAWLGGAVAGAPKLQKSIYLSITLSDLGSDSQGIRSVSVFTKKKVTNFLSKYSCSFLSPSVATFGCSRSQPACGVRWRGPQTPIPSGKMTYHMRVPFQETLELGNICARVSKSLPKNSCVFLVETISATSQLPCSVAIVVYQRTCTAGTCSGMSDMRLPVPSDGDDRRRRFTRRLLQDLHYGALAAEYVVPHGWQPLDLVTNASREVLFAQPDAKSEARPIETSQPEIGVHLD